MKRLSNIFSERKEALKTVAVFLILCFTLNFAYFKIAGEQIIPRELTASLVALFLNLLFGLNAKVNGTFVLTNGSSIDVIGECTGILCLSFLR